MCMSVGLFTTLKSQDLSLCANNDPSRKVIGSVILLLVKFGNYTGLIIIVMLFIRRFTKILKLVQTYLSRS
jgi:hypothetical protein